MFIPIDLLVLMHIGLTFFMTGLIWFVQIVHYPLFAAVGRGQFPAYERQHMRRVSWVVGPVMIAEAASAVGLLWLGRVGDGRSLLTTNIILLAFTWLGTVFFQMPQHNFLREGFDTAALRRLVQTNWIRTICWSLRCVLLVYGFPAVVATIAFAPSGNSPR
jgi:hypothetical protein